MMKTIARREHVVADLPHAQSERPIVPEGMQRRSGPISVRLYAHVTALKLNPQRRR
jgi:hypothetical protein